MIGEADLVAFAFGVHHVLAVQIEQKRAFLSVVDFAATVRLVLRDHFAAILGNELILERFAFQENAPAGYFGRRQQ